jgi:hypothetical protein
MIGKSGSKIGSVGALLVKLVSAAGARILHDFPRRPAQKTKNLQELYIAATSILEPDRPSWSGRIDFIERELVWTPFMY